MPRQAYTKVTRNQLYGVHPADSGLIQILNFFDDKMCRAAESCWLVQWYGLYMKVDVHHSGSMTKFAELWYHAGWCSGMVSRKANVHHSMTSLRIRGSCQWSILTFSLLLVTRSTSF